jgi:very-short-patch-repair endonuclease
MATPWEGEGLRGWPASLKLSAVERQNLKPRTRRARALRADSTDAEWKLWAILRGRGLEGVKFRRQVPVGRYFADFACLEARLIVELDGGQHDAQADYDARRTEDLEAAGWRVIRFWNNEVVEAPDGVARSIAAELALARPGSPTPLPEGEGGAQGGALGG